MTDWHHTISDSTLKHLFNKWYKRRLKTKYPHPTPFLAYWFIASDFFFTWTIKQNLPTSHVIYTVLEERMKPIIKQVLLNNILTRK